MAGGVEKRASDVPCQPAKPASLTLCLSKWLTSPKSTSTGRILVLTCSLLHVYYCNDATNLQVSSTREVPATIDRGTTPF